MNYSSFSDLVFNISNFSTTTKHTIEGSQVYALSKQLVRFPNDNIDISRL